MALTHRFVSAKTQAADGTVVSKDEWNDAHKFDHSGVVPGHRVGATEDRWYPQTTYPGIGLTTGAPTANRLRAFPFIPAKDMTLDQIAFNVTTLLAGFARVGIYNGDGNLYPSSLIVDGGSVATGTVGVKAATISVPVLGGDLYWLAYSSSVNVTVRGMAVTGAFPILGWDATLGFTAGLGWDVAFTYAALPTSYPAGAAAVTGTPIPAIFVRGT